MRIKLSVIFVLILFPCSLLTGCYPSNAKVINDYHAQHESVQGTQKTKLNAVPVDIADIKIPLIINNIKMMRLQYGEDVYDILKSHFEISGDFLVLEILNSPARGGEIKTSINDATKLNTMAHPFSKSMSVIVRAKDGEELKEYECSASVVATTIYSRYDRAFKVGAYMKDAFSLLDQNCWAELINQMADDESQIYDLNDKYL
jgi:hypothetical protein